MKTALFTLFVLIMCFSIPVMAQENEKSVMLIPPTPLSEQFVEWQWLLGEWEGYTELPAGKSIEWQKNELGLDDQFLLMEGKSEMSGMVYKGMGAITVDSKSGELMGYWIDNMRGMYIGKGTIGVNQYTMTWDGPMGKSTRITEKVNDDEFIVRITAMSPDGKPMDVKVVMKRKTLSEKLVK